MNSYLSLFCVTDRCFRKRMTKAEYGEDNVAFETEDHRSKREKR